MKKCIWCNKTEELESFDKPAHTFPKSLGGKKICESVCDSCNHFFGSPRPNYPSVEVVFKELLNVSKFLILSQTDEIPKNTRYKSEYFKLNLKSYTLKIKHKYKLRRGFQEKIGRAFRRGFYKVYLEERERQLNDADNDRFDFIREFARYDLGNYPIYVIKPKHNILAISNEAIADPSIPFNDLILKKEKEFGVHMFILMGRTYCIPISRNFENFSLDRFRKHLLLSDNPIGTELIPIQEPADLDFTFNFIHKKSR